MAAVSTAEADAQAAKIIQHFAYALDVRASKEDYQQCGTRLSSFRHQTHDDWEHTLIHLSVSHHRACHFNAARLNLTPRGESDATSVAPKRCTVHLSAAGLPCQCSKPVRHWHCHAGACNSQELNQSASAHPVIPKPSMLCRVVDMMKQLVITTANAREGSAPQESEQLAVLLHSLAAVSSLLNDLRHEALLQVIYSVDVWAVDAVRSPRPLSLPTSHAPIQLAWAIQPAPS